MAIHETISYLMGEHNLAVASVSRHSRKRFAFEKLKSMLSNRVFIGIAGLRGSGKTVLLRQLAAELENSIYMSADTLQPGIDLFEIAKELSTNYKIKYVLIDEIHGFPEWQKSLKKIFDFLELIVIFTSSSSIEIIQSRYDLSRRVVVFMLYPFSFREYLLFKHGIELNKLSLKQIIQGQSYPGYSKYEPYFEEYCRQSLPVQLESAYPETVLNVFEKIITKDILASAKLDSAALIEIRKIALHIANSSVDGCSYSSISANTGVSKYKTMEYVKMLEHTHLIQVILPYGTNVTKEPKIIFMLPFRHYISKNLPEGSLKGSSREEFFVMHVLMSGANLMYLKSARGEKTPDYVIMHEKKKLIIEIGGHSKSRKQLKGIGTDQRILLTQPGNPTNGIPLVLFGFLD